MMYFWDVWKGFGRRRGGGEGGGNKNVELSTNALFICIIYIDVR
jgi:hypothetical protein